MLLSITASRLLLEAVIDACSLEIAIRGVGTARWYDGAARPHVELGGPSTRLVNRSDVDSRRRPPGVRVIVDRWILQLVQDFIESSRPRDVRAFIEEAVVTHIDRLAATGPIGR
jgi:hypothetical protein